MSRENSVIPSSAFELKRQARDKDKYAADVDKLLLTEEELSMAPIYVLSAYLFNPYLILSCAAQTTTVFANLFLAVFYYSMLHDMQQGFVVGCFFLVTSVLAPVLWHLWIYSRSANANFYFGVTLAFATAQIFLIPDILFAYIKREFALIGLERVIDGKEAKLE